ncbi:MAG TPA: MFS transporter [Candidatus Paceibacterota bacterium]|nr:MFS transporter [Verrucomicrobiota bacterium]HSA09816.1 MFS transporter [Candidatus Paceibacterota bacterium]
MSQQTATPPPPPPAETTLADVKQLGLWASIASLSYVFWVCGGMEMVERLAYYGVRAVATLYATRPASEGGLGVTMATFGTLLLCWNLLQSLIPIFTGGLSDRYGYKETIFASTVIKALGYLVMAWFHSYWGFFAGAMLLATGTAIFKPGVQGTLIKATNRRNSSMAWGIFYQTVNIGGWIGPLIALQMRQLSWKYVFYINAAVICCNFLLLLTYREPGKEERLARQQRLRSGAEKQRSLALEALAELKKPHLALYLVIFSVWWLMFPMLWDVLPKYIEDWVDTAPMVQFLFGADGTHSGFWHFLLGMDKSGQTIQPEGIVNINAGMIMLTCFLFAGLSAKLRATTSMLAGTVMVVAALTLFGLTNLIGFAVLAMIVFSIGEMLASPKFSEFLGNIAPPDKKAMWIGFSQAPILIGWTIEGKLGPQLYHIFSAKDVFARQMLVERGLSPAQVTEQALPIGEAFKKLVEVTGETPAQLTHALYQSHHVGVTWYVFAAIGVASAVMIYLYGRWILKLAKQEASRQSSPGHANPS